MKNNLNKKSGFSLMELIIVIVIIGILIGAVVGLGNQREVAKVSALEQMIAQSITATNGWAALQGQEDFTPLNCDQGNNDDDECGYITLKEQGSLPANFDPKKMHPWNGSVQVYSLDDGTSSGNANGTATPSTLGQDSIGDFTASTAGNLQNHFVIQVNNLPKFACVSLRSKFQNKHFYDTENGYDSDITSINDCDNDESKNAFLLIQ